MNAGTVCLSQCWTSVMWNHDLDRTHGRRTSIGQSRVNFSIHGDLTMTSAERGKRDCGQILYLVSVVIAKSQDPYSGLELLIGPEASPTLRRSPQEPTLS